MQPNFNRENLKGISYLVGDEEILAGMPAVQPHERFSPAVVDFLDRTAKKIMADRSARQYPDVVTLAFWMRKANLLGIEKEIPRKDFLRYIGRGMVFHIAPSNVPVNYAYSLITGLLAGNANVIKAPSKDFEQVTIVNRALRAALADYPEMAPYVVVVRYGHQKEINDALSEFADARVIWGGDRTIAEIRKSPLPSRAVEVAFADRYSLAAINADYYLAAENKTQIARDFFNDTYLTDQNACTSPMTVAWTGKAKAEAKRVFWQQMHELLQKEYELQPVQAVNKLTKSYLLASAYEDVRREEMPDNLIFRMGVGHIDHDLMLFKENSGFFMEYDCEDIGELKDLCNDTHCQTLSYLGEKDEFARLAELNLKGIDRIVPMGKAMDFEFNWDGYDLMEMLCRIIRIA
ncbi:MAG: acyl-CoA reductase [Firmicutes bacterium]|nr:acyl-CoA reductase [Bacillota bacterium]